MLPVKAPSPCVIAVKRTIRLTAECVRHRTNICCMNSYGLLPNSLEETAMITQRRTLLAALATFGAMSLAPEVSAQGKGKDKDKDKAKKEHRHHSGKDKLGAKVKQNGNHVIDKHGDNMVSVDVKDGKVAGMRVKHAKKGDVQVTKYKTAKKMASANSVQLVAYDTRLAQASSLGTAWIGYAYIDDYGYEEIYWYPYEMIYDGDTGAVEYVPLV